jgi:hypothetical protein
MHTYTYIRFAHCACVSVCAIAIAISPSHLGRVSAGECHDVWPPAAALRRSVLLVPGAAVGARPLEHVEVTSGCTGTGLLVPGTAVGAPTGARRDGLPRLHTHMCTGPRDSRWLVPTGAPRDGLPRLPAHTSTSPMDSRWPAPTAARRDGLPWLHTHTSTLPKDSRWSAPIGAQPDCPALPSARSARAAICAPPGRLLLGRWVVALGLIRGGSTGGTRHGTAHATAIFPSSEPSSATYWVRTSPTNSGMTSPVLKGEKAQHADRS